MKVAFLGTPEVAACTLRAVVAAGHDVPVVVTRPDKRRGRGGAIGPSPVKAAALELGLSVVHQAADVVGKGADLGVVVAFGRLVRPEVLEQLTLVNVHFSLLPRWRGAAPVERAILAGDDRTGVCLMKLEEGLDTGPVYARAEVAIGLEETAAELRSRLGALGTDILLNALAQGLPTPVPQVGEPTYAAKIEPEELRLDFTQAAAPCHRVVRVGRAWTTWRGRRLLVRRARAHLEPSPLAPGEIAGDIVGTGEGTLELLLVQLEGRAVMSAPDWARGAHPVPGERLGA
ncbi:MAG TPA: methionyl-tRNA formyltransferase [Acidimicrobiales bacterium]|nr:methionyl-tRNA formyltransferase [Acidimicrobiales bacterium]